MKRLCVVLILVALAGQVLATGAVRGDSIFLFNSGSTGSLVSGCWALATNDGGGTAATLPITSYTSYNDTNYTPNPNNPLVGDVNGDGVSDVVVNGMDGNGHTMFLGRNTATTAGQGDLLAAPIGNPGWNENWSPHWAASKPYYDSLVADVDGDGYADAVTVRNADADDTFSFWEATHSDAQGLEGNAPAASAAWIGLGVDSSTTTALVGDFNGDGADDVANQNASATVVGIVSTLGTGLNGANPTFWGGMGYAPNHIATLVGDIDGDGIDDIVQVDDRNSDGSWTWVAGLTGANGAIPAGYEIAQGGANSWCAPFTLDAASTNAVPLLADIDNDGRDDLVLFEEYVDAGSGNVWARILVSFTDDVAGGLFTNAYDVGSWYDYTGMFGVDGSGMVPIVGNVHIPEPATMMILGLGSLALIRRKK